ncbi:hypothetical protein CAP36_09825 [Chitinophagaceae bacterium IBVUCB2]|nr:hypothetical protein CAP36_09825 [Chitinophagaceae bacterium IBVUCB2]
MGVISSLALLLPVILVLSLRLGRYKTFPVLITYYFLLFIYNLMTEGYLKTNEDVVFFWGLGNNLLDAPLMIWFLSYFSTSPVFTKKLRLLIAIFIGFEITVLAIKGINTEAITIILGPGILIVLSLGLYFFIKQAKIAITHRKATGKALICAALLFAYGCYGIVYLIYYVFKAHIENGKISEQYVADTFLVYFFVTSLSSILMCIGIVVERKRIQKLNELKLTRKELSSIYTNTKTAAPLRTAMLDFDKDLWN